MKKEIFRLTESDLHGIVQSSVAKILRETWNNDRFEYDHFTDDGNGGIEEYGANIANLIDGLGSDSDALHAVGEEVAQILIMKNDGKERVLRPFIEGLIAGYKSGPNFMNPSPQDIYDQHGIVRN